MFSPLRKISVVLSGVFLSTSLVWAGVPGLEGIVKDANGKALPGAEVRIEGKAGASAAQTVKTDANGRYVYKQSGVGTFNVTLVHDGKVKASITNVEMRPGQTETLNFELRKSGVRPSAQGKHYVWVPAPTGSHLAGSWIEVEDSPKKISAGMNDRIERSGPEMVRRIQDNSGGPSHH